MKKIIVCLLLVASLGMPQYATNAQSPSNMESELKAQLIQLLLKQISLLRAQLERLQTLEGSEIKFGDTLKMAGWSGAGFFDGESFIVQEITLQNTTDQELDFDASDLRLRDSAGTVFVPVHESGLKDQPRFKNTITDGTFPSDNLDTRNITLNPNEEVKIAVTFYIDKTPADTTYTIRYKGGEPSALSVDN